MTNEYSDFQKELIAKIEAGTKLSSYELSQLYWEFLEVYREESSDLNRWSRSVISVFDINGQLYALCWQQGLTEAQDDNFWDQLYKVRLETKQVVVEKTFIIKEE